MISKDELIKRIQRNLKNLEESKSMWNQIIPEKIPIEYFSMGLETRGIAIYSLLLDKKQDGLEWFEKSAGYFESCVRERRSGIGSGLWESEAGNCNDMLNSAILSGNKEIVLRAATVSLNMDPAFPVRHRSFAPNYYYVLALSCIVMDDMENASKHAGRISICADRFKEHFTGLKTCVEGLINKDKALLSNGLIQVLEFHHKQYSKKAVTADEIICIPATVQIQLARNKELTITQEDIEEKHRKYVPWNLFE